jgi:acetoacetate decarboxylase
LTIVCAGVLGVALGGCGGDDDKKESDSTQTQETAVRTVLADLQQASVAGDGKRICTQIFTPKLADSVTKSAKSGSCAKEVRQKLFSPTTKLTVQNVTVTDPVNATATIAEANGNVSNVFLVRQSGRWRIRSVQPA